ncbi:hypothetical protein CYMTET_20117 [Cymbomonas tetramitiformis]|uniref:Uncharacterized protein n=1 Tax=Cymbomonas tetramitiformis TaxID=36881 RepID=A0AAE0G609_9CHLO|nr:hypothetical protein CYMTET_20117 [Cymbomonas tetramitiformis]
MGTSDSLSSLLERYKLVNTGTKEEDRATFVRQFTAVTEEFKRVHDSHALWESIPSMLAGEDSSTSLAYSWWCESYAKGGITESNQWRVLKDTSEHGPSRGAVRCAQPPFHDLEAGATWSVCRPAVDADAEMEVSEEYLTVGTSVKGLVGPNIEECIKLLRIKIFRTRVAEQELTRRAGDEYARYETRQHGINLQELLAAVKAHAANKGSAEKAGDVSETTAKKKEGVEQQAAKNKVGEARVQPRREEQGHLQEVVEWRKLPESERNPEQCWKFVLVQERCFMRCQ